MALARTPPTCIECGEYIEGRYRDVNKGVTDPGLIFIGDTFEGWDYKGHMKICKIYQREKNIDEILKNK